MPTVGYSVKVRAFFKQVEILAGKWIVCHYAVILPLGIGCLNQWIGQLRDIDYTVFLEKTNGLAQSACCVHSRR
jgi:hypothetical protein